MGLTLSGEQPRAPPPRTTLEPAFRGITAQVKIVGDKLYGPDEQLFVRAIESFDPASWQRGEQVLAEAVRSWHHFGGPWAPLGASQWVQPATLAPASVGGVWLVSFLVVAVNTALVGAILRRSWRAAS